MLNITYERYFNITNDLNNLYVRIWDPNYIHVWMEFFYPILPLLFLILVFAIYILSIRNSFKGLYEKIYLVNPIMLKKRLNELKKMSIIFGQLKNISKYENINMDSIIDYIEKDVCENLMEPSCLSQKQMNKLRSIEMKKNRNKKKSVKFFNLRPYCLILIALVGYVMLWIVTQRLQTITFFAMKDRMAIFVN